jgi:hypothetical protein
MDDWCCSLGKVLKIFWSRAQASEVDKGFAADEL